MRGAIIISAVAVIAACSESQRVSSDVPLQTSPPPAGAQPQSGRLYGLDGHVLNDIQPKTAAWNEHMKVACKGSVEEGRWLWETHTLNSGWDPTTFSMWLGEWEWATQPKPGSWTGGYTTRGEFRTESLETGKLMFRGVRIGPCLNCYYQIREGPFRWKAHIVDKYLVFEGNYTWHIYWYEQQGNEIALFGGAYDGLGGFCLERRGRKIIKK